MKVGNFIFLINIMIIKTFQISKNLGFLSFLFFLYLVSIFQILFFRLISVILSVSIICVYYIPRNILHQLFVMFHFGLINCAV